MRREEVAQLAGVSVDYVVRLEQGRGPRPSSSVLAALARALRLNDEDRTLLFQFAGAAPPQEGSIDMVVRPSVLRLLDRMADLPALVLSAKADVLAWNPMAVALLGDFSAWPPARRNIIWQRFLGTEPGRVAMTPAEADNAASLSVSALRSARATPTIPASCAWSPNSVRAAHDSSNCGTRGGPGSGAARPRRSSIPTSECCVWTAIPCWFRTPTKPSWCTRRRPAAGKPRRWSCCG